MATTSQKKKFGALLILLLVALVAGVSLIIVNQLRDDRERYFVRFQDSVSGLEVGSIVKMMGVYVGQVETISIADPENVVVRLALDPDTPISMDTRAVLTSLGVTGLQFVELMGGNARSVRLTPDTPRSIIKAGASTFKQLMARSRTIAGKLDALNRNVAALSSGEPAVRAKRLKLSSHNLIASLGRMQTGNSERLRRIFRHVDRSTARMEQASRAFSKLRSDNAPRVKATLRAAKQASAVLEQRLQGYETRKAERSIARVSSAVNRRAQRVDVSRAAAAMERAAVRMGQVGGELSTALDRRSVEWRGIKKKLRKAGFFFKELARKFGQ
jgi:ABC-type transporter Mla subunit MlaD